MRKIKNKNCYARTNKNGEIISYRFFYSGKEAFTNKPKQYTRTWKVPKNLSNKEIELERKKAELKFIRECEEKSKGVFIQDNNITFKDFSTQWLEEIKLRENSYGSYVSAKNHLRIVNEYFGNYLLKNISPVLIQNFYNYLCSRTYVKDTVIVKKSFIDLIKNTQLKHYQLAENLGLNRLTLRMFTKPNQKVSMESAKSICSYFNVPLDKYFSIQTEHVKYSYATNQGIKTVLVMILNSAKKRMLIEHNYATKEYTNPITGTKKEKDIYNKEEAQLFIKYAQQEKDYRKKITFVLYLFLGLRNAEICGLEWKDIDLENGYLRIERNSLYFRGFGTITKQPKTKNSKRTVAMPNTLIEILYEYKQWWDSQKQLHGDLWQCTDRLLVNDDGNPIHPCTPAKWLKNFELQNGLSHIPPHSLRHTSITMQILAGVHLKEVARRVGHADERITLSIYTHTLKEEDKQAASMLDNYLMSQ